MAKKKCDRCKKEYRWFHMCSNPPVPAIPYLSFSEMTAVLRDLCDAETEAHERLNRIEIRLKVLEEGLNDRK